MLAYEFIARDRLGLTMCGQDADGEIEWVGSGESWRHVAEEEQKILEAYEKKKEFERIWR